MLAKRIAPRRAETILISRRGASVRRGRSSNALSFPLVVFSKLSHVFLQLRQNFSERRADTSCSVATLTRRMQRAGWQRKIQRHREAILMRESFKRAMQLDQIRRKTLQKLLQPLRIRIYLSFRFLAQFNLLIAK